MTKPKDDVEFVREVVRKAFWDIYYHERELVKTYRTVANASAMLVRGNYNFSVEDALNKYDENDETAETSEEWVKQIVGSAAHSIKYHEQGMSEGHSALAVAKIMIERGKYT